MRGELSIYGVFVPTLLVLVIVAAVVTAILVRIANDFGFYRFVAYRALVDVCLFILVLGLLAAAAPLIGFPQ
ncbi:DUF1656 domain-containing protein [Novosphingobium pentaromativorans]|uniref:DUF1656 domain-containing protein n=1 Tax=Novosphingobium pentaromativorans US6-1 TaxID=1088721 RepID=G6EIW2_9SPHN|nr:DUF1656 domain-containing protein [Novosphingobium pentaromativorans]AIT78923.1 hypothetical protein JI59_03380 [Novosphingobium pentaromativorans US6-1]EHJ58721.1 hypothetical protein NSU_4283 [Novosphingobium pentaromativorans US6-1]